ncbi:MAG: DegT/DnrJ/EryC1/StrS family aminotransferase [Bacteroidales bacterium]|nr:DegT/DnrJ/EryC1/StrS family aminotransferase [Bacteroidales bacterium]
MEETKTKVPLIKPFLPPLGEVLPYLQQIWETRILTNGGPLHEELERALCDYLGVKFISLFSSGSLALMIALKALDLKGEVITTPFTFPATLQGILWNNLQPVFADIDPNDLNIHPEAVEKAITPRTCAILPVHVFGIPCDVEMIHRLARKHNLRVIYDAAHSFGVRINGDSVCRYGDLSVMSFHATKVFNTFEGGAVVCHDEMTKKRIDALKNNGIDARYRIAGSGINAKMSEFQAAVGLCQLKYVNGIIDHQKAAVSKYRELLTGINGLSMLQEREEYALNYSFLPVIVDALQFGASRDELHDFLECENIVTRKYFSPLVCDSGEVAGGETGLLPVARKMAADILCIPVFHDITRQQISAVTAAINRFHQSRRKRAQKVINNGN